LGSFPQVFPPKSCIRLFPPHTRYTSRTSHSSRFYHPINSGWGVQIIKLLIMKFPPLPVNSSLLLLLLLLSSSSAAASSSSLNLQPSAGYGLSFTSFLDHTQRRATAGRSTLDEW
jgi:hypothetical protein